MLIRKNEKNNKAELVLLDHGLYQFLPLSERKNLCYLWKSIVLHDEIGMHKYSSALGVEGNLNQLCLNFSVFKIFITYFKAFKKK